MLTSFLEPHPRGLTLVTWNDYRGEVDRIVVPFEVAALQAFIDATEAIADGLAEQLAELMAEVRRGMANLVGVTGEWS